MFLLDQYSVVTNFTSTRIRKLVGMRRPENANTPHTTLNGLHKRRHAQLSRQLQDSLWLTEPKCNVLPIALETVAANQCRSCSVETCRDKKYAMHKSILNMLNKGLSGLSQGEDSPPPAHLREGGSPTHLYYC